MSKLTNAEIVKVLANKGLTLTEDNPNLLDIAKTLGVVAPPQFEVSRVYNVAKAKETKELPKGKYDEPNALANGFIAIKPLKGQAAWIRVAEPEQFVTRAHVEALAEALMDAIAEIPEDK